MNTTTAAADSVNATLAIARHAHNRHAKVVDKLTREIQGVSHGIVWKALMTMTLVKHKIDMVDQDETTVPIQRVDAIMSTTFEDTYDVLSDMSDSVFAFVEQRPDESAEDFIAFAHTRFAEYAHFVNKVASNKCAATVTLCHACLLSVNGWAESTLCGPARAIVDRELKRRFVRMAKGQRVGWTQKAMIASMRAHRPALM